MQIEFPEFIFDQSPIFLCKYSNPSSHILTLVLCFMNNTWVEYVSVDLIHALKFCPLSGLWSRVNHEGKKIIWPYADIRLHILVSLFILINSLIWKKKQTLFQLRSCLGIYELWLGVWPHFL